ncbi:MAG: phage tail protein, partial [Clostridiales bacterium]|nr:phage tail protein [Clostridiales bacterium]
EWVTDLTDFFEVSKVTPLGAMKNLTDTLEKYRHHCELYIDNYNIALVKQIGIDRGARLDTAYNAKEMKVKRDTSELITRLYPYGKEDMPIGKVNNSKNYIESENITTWEREGYEEFSEIDNPTELKTAAQWLFSADNPDRVDIPKYSVTVSYAQRKDKEIRLGDIVTVIDRQYNITSKQRATEVKIYPFEPNKNEVTVGSPPKSIAETFKGMASTSLKYQSTVNERGEVKPSWLENLKGGYSTLVNKAISGNEKEQRKTVIHDYGDIWVNPNNPNQALALVGGVIAMANGKDSNGDWVWSAFGDWSGFTADKLTTGTLNTSNVLIRSNDGKTTLSGNLMTMKDTSGNIRLKMGLDGGVYVFNLYNAQEDKTVSLNSYGGLTLKGSLDTTQAVEGECGYEIDGDSILGSKYSGGKWVRHGLRVFTNEDKDETNFMLYIDGIPALNLHSFTESGKRKTAFAVNNTSYDENKAESSTNIPTWRAFEVVEGSEYATTKCWGDWDFADTKIRLAYKYAPTGNVVVNGFKFKIRNGLIEEVVRTSDANGINLKYD